MIHAILISHVCTKSGENRKGEVIKWCTVVHLTKNIGGFQTPVMRLV